MTPHIQIHLHADGSYSLRTQRLDSSRVHVVRNCIKLAGRCHFRLRSYVAEALHIVPEVITYQRRTDPPSGGFVAGE